jgi:hypothetical protein
MEQNRNTTKDQRMLTGMFTDRESAENAYSTLQDRGYSNDEIDLIMSDETRKKNFSSDEVGETEMGTKAAEGMGKGSAIGGTIGAIAGIIAALGTSVAIPGLGLVIAGPLAAGAAGAGAGGLTGGIIGALIGSGIPEARAKVYESGIKKGNIVLGVRPRNDEDAEYLQRNWRENKGSEIYW